MSDIRVLIAEDQALMRRLRGRQARFRRDCDHVLSKQVAQASPPGGTVVLENLTNIRKRTRVRRKRQTSRRIHGWSFAQLKGFIDAGRGISPPGELPVNQPLVSTPTPPASG